MMYQLQLTDVEREMVLQLLENERQELHPEVRRSSMSPATHEDLQKRLQLVSDLIERLKERPGMA